MKNKYRFCAVLFILMAISAAVYVLYSTRGSSAPVGCSQVGGCGDVLNSSWSLLFGVPVLYLGLGLYGSWLGSCLFSKTSPKMKQLCIVLSFVIIFGALWFAMVQLFILRMFCPWCCIVHTLASVGAVIFLFECKRQKIHISNSHIGFALVSVVIFAISQAIFPSVKSTYISKGIETIELNENATLIRLYGGSLVLHRNRLPIIAESKKPAALCILLSDYTCPHCLEFHQSLIQNADKISQMTTIYYLPVYHNSKAREINRLMLILQKADHDAYVQLLAEMASQSVTTDYHSLKKRGNEMLNGNYELYFKSYMEWTEELLKAGAELKQLNQEKVQASVFPQLMVGGQLIEGSISLDELLTHVKTNAGMKFSVTDPEAEEKKSENSTLVFEENKFDLGRITKNEVGRGVIHVRNDGDQMIEISKVGGTCSCLHMEKGPRQIPAHGMVNIPFEFHTEKFLGKVTHSVLIYEKGMRRPASIPVTVNVWLPVRIFPLKNNLGRIATGSKSETRVIPIITTEIENVHIHLKSCDHSNLQAELKTIKRGRHYELSLTITDMPDQSLVGEVTLTTDHPKCPEIILPYSATNVPSIECFPRMINAAQASKSRSIRINLVCNDYDEKKRFQITGIRYVGSQALDVSYKMDNKAGHAIVTALLGDDFDFVSAEQNGETIEIETNQPNFLKIKIPIKK